MSARRLTTPRLILRSWRGPPGAAAPRRADRGRVRALRDARRHRRDRSDPHGDRVAIRDELGEITYQELDQRSNALANAWREQGLKSGDGVAILARNHRGFLEAVFAAAKCGARIVLLNTSFAGPQIREVAGREGTDLLVYDDEYAATLEGIDPPHGRWRAWTEPSEADGDGHARGADRAGLATRAAEAAAADRSS